MRLQASGLLIVLVVATTVCGQAAKPPLDVARDRQAAGGAAEQHTGEKPVSAAEKPYTPSVFPSTIGGYPSVRNSEPNL